MKNSLYAFGLMMLLMVSCQQEPTLQKYFVENSEDPGFITLDIAPNFVDNSKMKLTGEEQEALKSLHKLNVLAFKVNDKNQAQFKQEKQKVQTLLKSEDYEELMHVGSSEQGASIHTVGDGDKIEEFVIYAHQKENGLAVVRVMGEDMNPNNIMTLVGLLQKGAIDTEQLKPLQQLMMPQMPK